MDSFRKAASAVALAVGLAAPFAAEASGYYPYGAYNARHGDHGHHGHHGGRDGSYAAGVITGVVAGALLGVRPYGYYHRPAPVFGAPPIVYREPAYVAAPPPVVYREPVRRSPLICDDYNRCAPADRDVMIEGMQCSASRFAAQCPNGQRFALD